MKVTDEDTSVAYYTLVNTANRSKETNPLNKSWMVELSPPEVEFLQILTDEIVHSERR